jgi:hypothetical protein
MDLKGRKRIKFHYETIMKVKYYFNGKITILNMKRFAEIHSFKKLKIQRIV